MENKTILITGAGSGLGMFIAKEYASLGAKVLGVDLNEEGLMKAKQEFGLIPFIMDISKESEWERNADHIQSSCNSKIDICIANAGVLRMGNATSENSSSWDLSVNVNLTGAYLTVRFAMPHLLKIKGNIVFIGSSSSVFSAENEIGYISTKHGMVGLMKSISIDYGIHGVRSNMVSPGWMKTAMSDKEMEVVMNETKCSLEEAYLYATKDIPLKRPGLLSEMFNAIHFISSDKAGFITGINLLVDGGASIVDAGMIGVGSLNK